MQNRPANQCATLLCVDHMQPFVGVDGEEFESSVRYGLICSSSGESLQDRRGISTADGLDFLYDIAQTGRVKQRPILVGFAFQYDVNMILRDVPLDTLRTLWRTSECVWRGWAIRYKPRREFAFRPRISTRGKKPRWSRVWDVFGFFQTRFVTALEKWRIGSPAMIARMKAERGTFKWRDLERVRDYCFAECDALAELMETLRAAATQAGIKVTRWDGAGALAGSLMSAHKMKRFHAPRPARSALQNRGIESARCAYYGGRIEVVRWGQHNDALYAYDLRSAYPAALAQLPCMACGEWIAGGTIDTPWRTHYVEWRLDGLVLPFPWRARDGSILYARTGRGWYWDCELRSAQDALRAGIITGTIRVLKSFTYVPQCDHAPWSWIPEVYAERERFLQQNNAAEKPLKLGLNSLYGKCAQRAGNDGRRPPYQQLVWASLTTAMTRSTLYRASWPVVQSGDLVAYATDAIMTTAPLQLPGPVPGTPGGWTSETYPNATVVMPGVYWLGDRVMKSRGWRSTEIVRDTILGAWQARQTAITLPTRRFIGLGLALTRRDPMAVWRVWHESTRQLALNPLGPKRMLPRGARLARLRPWQQLVDTIPSDCARYQLRGVDSTPLVFSDWQKGLTVQEIERMSELRMAQLDV